MPNAMVYELEGSGHVPLLEAPVSLAKILDEVSGMPVAGCQ